MEQTKIPYDGKKMTVFRNGMIYSKEAEGFRLPREQRKWKAQWIWAPAGAYPEYQNCDYTMFQRKDGPFAVFVFQKKMWCGEKPDRADLYITADSSYKVFINGRPVGRGSAQPGGDYANCESVPYKFYENYKVQDFLRAGENVITVRVCLGAVVQSEISCGHGGLLAEITDGRENVLTATDDTWKCVRDRAYTARSSWDGTYTLEEEDWGYRDETWDWAEVVKKQELFPPVYATPIPNLIYLEQRPEKVLNPFEPGAERVFYDTDADRIRITKGAPVTFWLDFGRICAAYFFLNIKGGKGTKAVLHMQEFPGKVERDGTTVTLTLGDEQAGLETLRMQSIRYVQITLSNVWQDCVIHAAGINISAYPSELKGSFQCSDPLLEKIYLAGCRTNQICRQTYHMDSPIHQEPLGCMGDYMIESLMNYVTFGDPYLTRFDILKIAAYLKERDYRMFHPSYCLLYIGMILDYAMYSGDLELLSKTEETIDGILRLFTSYLGGNGLIEKAPNYMFMDWVEDGGFNRHHPPKCMGQGYLTAMFAGALERAVSILHLLGGREEKINGYERLRRQVAESIHRELWDEEKQLYVDGLYDPEARESTRWMPADVDRRFYSQHMNTLAVLYHIVPKEREQELMARVMEDPTLSQAQPYFMHFVFEALQQTGLFDRYGLKQIRRWESLLDENPDALKEVWYGFDCDYSHAWGGTPTYQLPTRILGVVPAEPGFGKIRFQPCLPPELTYARGSIPTPKGEISVELTRFESEVKVRLDLPEGVGIAEGK